MKTSLLLLIFLVMGNVLAFDQNHWLFTQLLKKNYKVEKGQGLVNYKAIKANPSPLQNYLKQLKALDTKTYESFNDKEKLAFWINAYNAYTIKLIVDNYPLKSIKDIGSFFSGPWSQRFIPLLGKKMTLDEIEHETIRKQFKEPRIHFAVNCASMGCPNLFPEAITGAKLEKQLEQAARSFLTLQHKNFIKGDELHLSKIFKWYGKDFASRHKDYFHFIAPFLSPETKLRDDIANGKLKIQWNDYDWNLNEWK